MKIFIKICNIIVLSIFLFSFSVQLFSQDNDLLNKTDDVEKKDILKKKKTDDISFIDEYDLRIGFLAGAIIPVGDLAEIFETGYSGFLFGDMLIPYKINDGIFLRGGLFAGYMVAAASNGTYFTGTLNIAQFIPAVEISYLFDFGLRPYFGLGCGISYFTIIGKTYNLAITSSTDGTLALRFGSGYTHSSLRNIEFLIDFTYIMAFETVTGQFFNSALGVKYRFSTSGHEEKTLSRKSVAPMFLEDKVEEKKSDETIRDKTIDESILEDEKVDKKISEIKKKKINK